MDTYKEYFTFSFFGIGWKFSDPLWVLHFEDETRWYKSHLGFYIRY